MAASLVQKLGTDTTSPYTFTVPAGGIPAGDLIAVAWSSDTGAVTGITDTAGNTYAAAISHFNNCDCEIWYSRLANALASGNTITVAGSGIVGVAAAQFTGIVATPLDKTAGSNGASTSQATGTTTATAQADELAIAAVAINGDTTLTVGGAYTLLDSVGNATGQSLGWAYLILSATGTQTATFTSGATGSYDSAIATFKATAGGGGVAPAPRGFNAIPFMGGAL